jgi:hypothetical protein
VDDVISLTLALMVKAANEQFDGGFIDVSDYGKAIVQISLDYAEDGDNLAALATLSYLPMSYFKEEMLMSALNDGHFASKVADLIDFFGADVTLLLTKAEGDT